jgi:alpha-tubulin suppressor-like RCC1 family protein
MEKELNPQKLKQEIQVNILDEFKYYKGYEAGYTFTAFLTQNTFHILGTIKDYIVPGKKFKEGKPNTKPDNSHESENHKIYTPSYEVTDYIPFHLSTNKFSLAILYKENKPLPKHDDFKDVHDLFNEINNSLKNRNLTFSNHFLSNLINEKLFADAPDYIPYIPESEFIEKVLDIITNSEKYVNMLTKYIEKMKVFGYCANQKLHIMKAYELIYKIHFSLTKVAIIGDFAETLRSNMKSTPFLDTWDRIYNSNFVIEFPNTFLPIKQVELGDNHVLMLTIDGEIYAFGDGSYGATGNGVRNFHYTPTKIHALKPFNQIACGARHSMATNCDDILYTWGDGKKGKLGHGNERDAFEPKKVESLSTTKIFALNGGDTYSTCVSLSFALFTWGSGEFGRLGHEDNADVLLPKPVDKFSGKALYVKCGYYCTLVMTTKQEIFALGAKSLFIKNSEKDTPQTISNNLPFFNPNNYEKIRQCEFNLKGEVRNLINMACGYQFVTVLTEERKQEISEDSNNNIYLFGKLPMAASGDNKQHFKRLNAQSDLTEKLKQSHNLFNKLTGRGGLVNQSGALGMRKIVLSENNTATISYDNDVYIFGSYLFDVATNKLENLYQPIQERGTKISKVALGSNHCILVTTDYDVFTWGRNKEGQLGLGNSSYSVNKPTRVPSLKNKGIQKAYACENYSVVLTYNNEMLTFGDLSFIENSVHLNYYLSPKLCEWGEVEKVACGPTHMLMYMRDHKTGKKVLKAVGNGTFGKLGDNRSEYEDNQYIPSEVDLQLPFGENSRKIKIRCSRYSSACLIKDAGDASASKLYIWGLFIISMFDTRDTDRLKTQQNNQRTNPIDNSYVQIKPHICSVFENVTDFAMNETGFMVITTRKELKIKGNFYSNQKRRDLNKPDISGDFTKVSLSTDHAAAITVTHKLFTWGFNIMNRLGLIEDENERNKKLDKLEHLVKNDELDYDDFSELFRNSPTNVIEFNKLFETKTNYEEKHYDKETPKDTPTADNTNFIEETPKETPKETVTEDTPDINEKKTNKDKQDKIFDNVFSKTQTILDDYRELETRLIQNEIEFKSRMKNILKNYEFLVTNEEESKNLKQVLFNQFNFKMIDPPLSIQIKKSISSKYPKAYLKYKKNYKALLSTLQMHPCYLANLYKHQLMTDKELYLITKSLYFNIYDDNYSKLILINLITIILTHRLKEEKVNAESLERFYIFKENNGEVEYDLFSKLCKLVCKSDINHLKKQEIVAIKLVNFVFAKIGSKPAHEMEKAMQIKITPANRKKNKEENMSSSVVNLRLDNIFTAVKEFFTIIRTETANLDQFKDTLFALDMDEIKKKYPGKLFKHSPIIQLLINKVYETISTVCETDDSEKLNDWIAKNLGITIFGRLLRIIENPYGRLSIKASIVVDTVTLNNFIELNRNNFYSIYYVLKYTMFGLTNRDLEEDDTCKKINLRIKDLKANIISSLRETITKNTEDNLKTDLLLLDNFFEHSMKDTSKVINFSLYRLKQLEMLITYNIDKMRVLNESFDLMDIIFFNKVKKELYIGKDGDLSRLDIGLENDVTIQVKLKTKALAYQNPQALMRCQHCKILLLNDFNLANEEVFYDEFPFFPKSSKETVFIKILKKIPTVTKAEIILDFLKNFIQVDENAKVKDDLYFLFTLIAIENKTELLLEESDINNSDRLLSIMLTENSNIRVLTNLSKRILDKHNEFKAFLTYHNQLFSILKKIEERATSSQVFKKDLFNEIKGNVEKGIGNPDMKRYQSSLNNSSKFVRLVKHIENIPKSKNLFEKLSKEKKGKLLPMREYNLKELVTEKVIVNIFLPNCDALNK